MGMRAIAERAQMIAALQQPLRVRIDVLDGFQRGAFGRQQAMLDMLEKLTDDMQLGPGQKLVNFGDAPGLRILDGYHAQRRLAEAYRLEHIFEGRAWQRVHIGAGLAAGEIGIGSFHTHEGNGIFRFDNGWAGHRGI
jgi:hypothetical protein